MNKDITKALQSVVDKYPEKILEVMLNTGLGLEIIERSTEDYEDSGNVFFKVEDKYFKVPFYNYSYGDGNYRFNQLVEVQPKTKTVTYFE